MLSGMSAEYCMVMATFPDAAVAARILEGLLAARLAACVQTLPIQSAYRWQGKIQREPEVLALIKTTAARYPEIEARIRAEHPYETPEIIAVPIIKGSREYINWLNDETESK